MDTEHFFLDVRRHWGKIPVSEIRKFEKLPTFTSNTIPMWLEQRGKLMGLIEKLDLAIPCTRTKSMSLLWVCIIEFGHCPVRVIKGSSIPQEISSHSMVYGSHLFVNNIPSEFDSHPPSGWLHGLVSEGIESGNPIVYLFWGRNFW
jgi:hypothetical protein